MTQDVVPSEQRFGMQSRKAHADLLEAALVGHR
jgi:hypothetical protein